MSLTSSYREYLSLFLSFSHVLTLSCTLSLSFSFSCHLFSCSYWKFLYLSLFPFHSFFRFFLVVSLFILYYLSSVNFCFSFPSLSFTLASPYPLSLLVFSSVYLSSTRTVSALCPSSYVVPRAILDSCWLYLPKGQLCEISFRKSVGDSMFEEAQSCSEWVCAELRWGEKREKERIAVSMLLAPKGSNKFPIVAFRT